MARRRRKSGNSGIVLVILAVLALGAVVVYWQIALAIVALGAAWFLFRAWAKGPPHAMEPITLNGGRELEVVGESHYQGALERAAGGRAPGGVDFEVVATLVPEPKNPHDRNAIAIQVNGETVGYLARAVAVRYQPVVRRLADAGQVGQCNARIVGGWDRGSRDRGSFGIWLDLATPAKAMPSRE
jgi:hypothetical protein